MSAPGDAATEKIYRLGFGRGTYIALFTLPTFPFLVMLGLFVYIQRDFAICAVPAFSLVAALFALVAWLSYSKDSTLNVSPSGLVYKGRQESFQTGWGNILSAEVTQMMVPVGQYNYAQRRLGLQLTFRESPVRLDNTHLGSLAPRTWTVPLGQEGMRRLGELEVDISLYAPHVFQSQERPFGAEAPR